jgi:antitoxin (DNA-binding transcriptional repressor) of toxin-antitoxin stability system
MKQITVTELSRGLSEFINRANYRGESFLITRGGKAVAQITPVPAGARVKDLGAILGSLPTLDSDDLDVFAGGLAVAREAMNEPVRDPWGS